MEEIKRDKAPEEAAPDGKVLEDKVLDDQDLTGAAGGFMKLPAWFGPA